MRVHVLEQFFYTKNNFTVFWKFERHTKAIASYSADVFDPFHDYIHNSLWKKATLFFKAHRYLKEIYNGDLDVVHHDDLFNSESVRDGS